MSQETPGRKPTKTFLHGYHATPVAVDEIHIHLMPSGNLTLTLKFGNNETLQKYLQVVERAG